MFHAASSKDPATSGVKDIGDALGGGIRPQSLTIIEGDSGSGKTILSQYISYGILISGNATTYYSSGKSCEEIIHQMESLNMEARHYYAADLLRVYSIAPMNAATNVGQALEIIIKHVASLPQRFKFIVIDCLTPFVEKMNQKDKVDAFLAFKRLCEQGRSVILVVHTHVFEKTTQYRVFTMSDYYLKLGSRDGMILPGIIDDRNIKTLEISKSHGVELSSKERIEFEIMPKAGIQVLPIVNIKI